MHFLHRVCRCITLPIALAAATAAVLLVSPAEATSGPPAPSPAQFYGPPWGGVPWSPPGFLDPSWSSPYAGSPGYPYYRHGAYYGSAYGLPYPISPRPSLYSADAYGPSYPLYPSAGGVTFGYTDEAGYYAPTARCVYSAIAGIGGSWYDPPTYGYYAPFC